METVDVSKYTNSPVHNAVASGDYASLKTILSGLPRPQNLSEIQTEAASLAEEAKADAISALIDRRDVPNRETPLHLAVKLRDATAAEMLMAAGADWTLQNEQGWNALQEAICSRQETIAMTIVQSWQALAWAKWCRRLPRLIATMGRMRDFYLEINFHFESSIVPFVSKIAPSDTYKIWKIGANLRADMTLAGFDGFKIQRSDQSILFLGDGSEDGKVPSGSLCMVSHKDKEVMNALDGAGVPASEEEVRKEVAAMSQSSIFRPGVDVTQAVLLPQTTWRHQEKIETVGPWKAKVYDMHNVVFSVKSRRVAGATTDNELFNENEAEGDELGDILTEEEKRQLEAALKLDVPDLPNENGDNDIIGHRHSTREHMEIPTEDFDETRNGSDRKQEKKGWFGGWRRKENKHMKHQKQMKNVPPRSSLCVDEKVSDLLGDSNQIRPGRHSVEVVVKGEYRKARVSSKTPKEANHGNEYKKGLRPVLWLSPNFPLRTEEILPLLDILANKVKAIRRLRDLLTTKLPAGTFPVKVAIPVVPTIRVLITFTKFEELQPVDEFKTPPSSPTAAGDEIRVATLASNSSSWFNWAKPTQDSSGSNTKGSSTTQTLQDPFAIPSDYTWVTAEAKKKKMQQKNKPKKGKSQNQ